MFFLAPLFLSCVQNLSSRVHITQFEPVVFLATTVAKRGFKPWQVLQSRLHCHCWALHSSRTALYQSRSTNNRYVHEVSKGEDAQVATACKSSWKPVHWFGLLSPARAVATQDAVVSWESPDFASRMFELQPNSLLAVSLWENQCLALRLGSVVFLAGCGRDCKY